MSNQSPVCETLFENKIKLISFISCVMVIYTHAYNVNVYGLNDGPVFLIEKIFKAINSVAVPSFFFISGLLFFRNFDISNLIDKWRRRIVSIVIPYVIWCIFYFIFFLVCSNIFSSITIDGIGVVQLNIKNFIHFIFGNGTYHFWFLQKLMIYIALAPIEWCLLKNRKANVGVISIFLLILIDNISPGYLPKGLIMYCFGSYISINESKILTYKNNAFSILSIFLIVVSFIFKYIWLYNDLIAIIYIIALWYFIDLLKLEETHIPWWMSITFFIYAAHIAVLEPIERIILILFGKSEFMALIDYIIAPILTLVVLIAIAYFLKKYCNKFWLLITGQRQ